MATRETAKLAVLIDADNAQASICEELPAEVARYRGKNATDSALIIDAMNILHAGGLHGFCLVSSDLPQVSLWLPRQLGL